MAGIRLYKGYSKVNIRVGVVKPIPEPEENPLVFVQPSWISGGYLGEFVTDSEVILPLQVNDPDSMIDTFILSGSLPLGLVLNTNSGVISGFIEDTTSQSYSFIVSIKTKLNQYIQQFFTIDTIALSTDIEWLTDSNLGNYNAGDNVSTSIDAESKTIIV